MEAWVVVLLVIIGLEVWLWLVQLMKIIAWARYKPHELLENPRYTGHHASVICTTVGTSVDLDLSIRSWLENHPQEIILATTVAAAERLTRWADRIGWETVRILAVPQEDLTFVDRRSQVLAAVTQCKSELIILAEEDATWQPTTLSYILSSFSTDDRIGLVSVSQGGKSKSQGCCGGAGLPAALAGMRWTSAEVSLAAAMKIDKGVTNLSVKTLGVKRQILESEAFRKAYLGELWMGRRPSAAAEGSILARWTFEQEFSITFQNHPRAQISTPLTNHSSSLSPVLSQALHSSRDTWRFDFRSIFYTSQFWSHKPFTIFLFFHRWFSPFSTLAVIPLVIYLSVATRSPVQTWAGWGSWVVFSRFCNLLPHFSRHPSHLYTFPVALLSTYVLCLIRIYTLLTLDKYPPNSEILDTPPPKSEEGDKIDVLVISPRTDGITSPRQRRSTGSTPRVPLDPRVGLDPSVGYSNPSVSESLDPPIGLELKPDSSVSLESRPGGLDPRSAGDLYPREPREPEARRSQGDGKFRLPRYGGAESSRGSDLERKEQKHEEDKSGPDSLQREIAERVAALKAATAKPLEESQEILGPIRPPRPPLDSQARRASEPPEEKSPDPYVWGRNQAGSQLRRSYQEPLARDQLVSDYRESSAPPAVGGPRSAKGRSDQVKSASKQGSSASAVKRLLGQRVT